MLTRRVISRGREWAERRPQSCAKYLARLGYNTRMGRNRGSNQKSGSSAHSLYLRFPYDSGRDTPVRAGKSRGYKASTLGEESGLSPRQQSVPVV